MMIKKDKIRLLLSGLLLLNCSQQLASEQKIQEKDKILNPPVLSLSPETKNLLINEMKALQKGMEILFSAYIKGDWKTLEEHGEKIKNSYIFKQKITPEQKQELKEKLPKGFFKLDRKFHYLSGKLKFAAGLKRSELVGFYYAQMGYACVECHKTYASHRFPQLIENND